MEHSLLKRLLGEAAVEVLFALNRFHPTQLWKVNKKIVEYLQMMTHPDGCGDHAYGSPCDDYCYAGISNISVLEGLHLEIKGKCYLTWTW